VALPGISSSRSCPVRFSGQWVTSMYILLVANFAPGVFVVQSRQFLPGNPALAESRRLGVKVSCMRKLIKRIALGLLFCCCCWSWPGLFFPTFLCVDSEPVKADVIVVLGGGSHERPERAAELFKEHAAPRIIVSGHGDGEINRHLLLRRACRQRQFNLEKQSADQGKMPVTVKLLREQKQKRVILVTSWYHSRRAVACFRHYAPEITFYSRPSILPLPAPIGRITASVLASVWNTRN